MSGASTDTTYRLVRGDSPLLISMPHTGSRIPEELHDSYQPRALGSEDSDWHLECLYGFAAALGAGLIVPQFSRYLIDLNRPPDDAPMYPGASNTELCPTRFFTGETLYREGAAPDTAERERRRAMYWQPYHDALRAETMRLREVHGHAVLFDAHSIRSVLPWLFEGTLPDLNLGTADGRSCDPALARRLGAIMADQRQYSQVVDGRFKGGFITRHYGRPGEGVHTVQLEMCQSCYMREAPPFDYDEARAEQVQALLHQMVRAMRDWRPGV